MTWQPYHEVDDEAWIAQRARALDRFISDEYYVTELQARRSAALSVLLRIILIGFLWIGIIGPRLDMSFWTAAAVVMTYINLELIPLVRRVKAK
jgi:hypothetical protein